MILPCLTVLINFYNLGRGINKHNEHWPINRLKTSIQYLQLISLPFIIHFPAASSLYMFVSTSLVLLQTKAFKSNYLMSRISPDFLVSMRKIFKTERSKDDSNRYIEKMKILEDTSIRSYRSEEEVLNDLEYELKKANNANITNKIRISEGIKYKI